MSENTLLSALSTTGVHVLDYELGDDFVDNISQSEDSNIDSDSCSDAVDDTDEDPLSSLITT